MESTLFYSPYYDFRIAGLEVLHPFDGKKYSKAFKEIELNMAADFAHSISFIERPVFEEELHSVHSGSYLKSLNDKREIAKVVEVSLLKFLPTRLLQKGLLSPAKWATYGTLCASDDALTKGKINFNIGGGFHHAFHNKGEGFCFFADAALAIESLREQGKLAGNDKVLMIDLDAHRGNGFESFYRNDSRVAIFDMYNAQAYPGLHPGSLDDFPFIIPLRASLGSDDYLETLKEELPRFLDTHKDSKLVFYNAGTDILQGDRLGGLNVSFDAVVERDKYVVQQLLNRTLPCTILTSGGYSSKSYKLISELAVHLLK